MAAAAGALMACGGSDGSGLGQGGSGGQNQCGIASCGAGFSLDAAECRCVPDGTGGSGGIGGSGASSGSGGTGGQTCGLVDCQPGFSPTPDNCSCVPTPVGPLPTTGTWIVASTVGAPSARVNHTVVWTGTEYIVWGGAELGDFGASLDDLGDGARYNPASDTWLPVSDVGAPSARGAHKAVWTGKVMAIFSRDVDVFPVPPMEGWLYDPAIDSWTTMSTVGMPSGRAYFDVVSVDGKVVVWGGWTEPGMGTTAFPDPSGGIYDPGTDSWSPIDPGGAPTYDGGHTTMADTGGFITFGATKHFLAPGAGRVVAARYDLGSGAWTELGERSGLASNPFVTTTFDGSLLLSVAITTDGNTCEFSSMPVGGAFTVDVIGSRTSGQAVPCVQSSRHHPMVVGAYLAEAEQRRLLDLATRELVDMSAPPFFDLTGGAVPAGYTIEFWERAVSDTDGQSLFSFGGYVQAVEQINCPDGAPCVAPQEISAGVSGVLFTP